MIRVRRSKGWILDFDIETVAAGFADPNWVPQKVTCVAWSWVGDDRVYSEICGVEGLYGDLEVRAHMLEVLRYQIDLADMVTGHNLIRFDLPVLNADMLRLGVEPLGPVLVQDTMRLVKTKGLKKGQDNLGRLLGTQTSKLSLDWQGWEDAYAQDGWPEVRRRCETDVLQHKQLRQKMLDEGDWLKPPIVWTP